MKNPLSYQRTEYDCGPTTLINAISFLFDREDIHPELIKSITTYTTDGYGASGEHGKGGTTRLAMMFISGWLNEFGRSRGFPIETEYLSGMSVRAERGGKLVQALNEGGAVVARVFHEP
ncbi:MAG: peptidase C39, partial [Clostridiales Family XIII bacterium]|nr:peptidase C39 [Clostridiales Family XIII bacterium]